MRQTALQSIIEVCPEVFPLCLAGNKRAGEDIVALVPLVREDGPVFLVNSLELSFGGINSQRNVVARGRDFFLCLIDK